MGVDGRQAGNRHQYWDVMSIDLGVDELGVDRSFGFEGRRLPHWQVIVNEESALGTKDFLERRLTAIKSQRSTGELEDLALIIGSSPV